MNADGYFARDTEKAIIIARLLIDTGVDNIEIITYKEDETGIQARFAVELRLMNRRTPANDVGQAITPR